LERVANGRAEEHARLAPLVRRWRRAVSDAFLGAYREAAAGAPSWPAADSDAQRLIALFTLEKALYEVRYELDNRPAWLGIPLDGVAGLLGVLGDDWGPPMNANERE
jgi:maltose alpha-D-glucosyltransferase / alpha-amylase